MTFTIVPQSIDLVHVMLAMCIMIGLVFLSRRKSTPSVSTPPSSAHATPVKTTEPESAQQLLALLQTEARLVDFLKEDISAASDADIGAVARTVHAGGRRVLENYIDIAPVRTEDEETPITLDAGYDAASIRITGNVTGQAPFKGRLIHRGWRVTGTRLPKITIGHDVSIIAPAEVEL